MSRLRSAFALLVRAALVAALVAVASGVRAEPPARSKAPLALRWRAPSSCPDEAAVRHKLARALPADVSALRVVGEVRAEAGGYVLSLLAVHDAQRFARSLRAERCAELVDALALLVALSLSRPEGTQRDDAQRQARDAPTAVEAGEPSAEGGRVSEGGAAASGAPKDDGSDRGATGSSADGAALAEPPADPTRAPTDASRTVPSEPPVDESRMESARKAEAIREPRSSTRTVQPGQQPSLAERRAAAGAAPRAASRRPSPMLAARIGASAGLVGLGLAGPALALAGSVGADVNAWALALSVSHLPWQRESAGPTSVSYSAQQLEAQLCRELRRGRIRFGPCAALSGWIAHARADGLVGGGRERHLWGSAGLSLMGRLALAARIELALEAGAQFPLSERPAFEVRGLGTIGEVRLVVAQVRLGLAILFD